MKRLLLFCFLISVAAPSFAQTCAQTLRLARATYEQGRLHEINNQLKGCFGIPEDEGGFNKEQKVEAYKILCLSYIYLEEPQLADEAMLNLKKTDPYYRPNPEVDPAEFVALYKSFREAPIYRYGARLGVIFSRPNVKELITPTELSADSEYKQLLGIQFGAVLGVPITLFKKQERFTLHGELLYQQNKFEIDLKENRGTQSEPLINSFTGIETQSRISLPITLEYKIMEKKYNPFIALGVGTDYLFNSKITTEKTREDQAGVPEKTSDLKPQREKINISALAAAGVKLAVGPGYLIGEVRYAHGLTNVSSAETVYANQSLALDYGYADSIFNLSSLSIAVTFVFNKFHPIKLTHKK